MEKKTTLKEILREKGVTLSGIGRVINRSPRAVQDRLDGKKPFNTEEIKKLREAYNLSLDIFFN